MIKIPRHVVYREFAAETVVLNMETGRYHGLKGSGGRMLQALDGASSIAEAADALATDMDVPRGRLERDLRELCAGLAERGLVEVDAGGHG
jgi:hypothetical protein